MLGPTDNARQVFDVVRPAFDSAFGEDSLDMEPWTASEDFSVIPKAFGSPYMLWTVGITPRKQWKRAEAADRLDVDIPTNHNPGFLPDLSTLQVTTKAAAVGVLSCLQATWEPQQESVPTMGSTEPTEEDIKSVSVETSHVE